MALALITAALGIVAAFLLVIIAWAICELPEVATPLPLKRHSHRSKY